MSRKVVRACWGVGLAIVLWMVGMGQSWAVPERVRVVTTTTDLKSLVQVVGGDRVEVTSIALPTQDPHTFEPKLGALQQLKSAQLLVKVGLDHDLWVENLLREAPASLQRGGVGYVDASTGIALLEVRATTLAPVTGHTHGAGNPHYWLDPLNAEVMTGSIVEGLSRVDPGAAVQYEANRSQFLQQLHQKVNQWEQELSLFQGVPLIAYHNSWPYLARRFRLKMIDYIEPKPGIPASPSQLKRLLQEIKTEQVPVILKEPYEPQQVPALLSQKTGARVVNLVSSVGALPEVTDYLSLFDYNVQALVQALSQRQV